MTVSRGSGPNTAATPLPPTGFLLLAGLGIFWGLNWPFMKIALSEIPVWPFRSICLIVGGGALLTLARLAGQPIRVPTAELRPMLICALFNVIGWHMCSGYGVSLMEAGRASIIAFTMPVWAAILAQIVLRERPTATVLIGLMLGVAGLAVLIGPDLRALETAPVGAFLMLSAAVSWAFGTVIMKRYVWSMPVAVLTGWQLVVGSVPITIGTLLFHPIPDPADLSLAALGSLAFILAFPMTFCQWAWFSLVRMFPAVIAAIGTLSIPVVGVVSSGIVLNEPIGPRELAALTLVCTALAVVLVLPALRRSKGT